MSVCKTGQNSGGVPFALKLGRLIMHYKVVGLWPLPPTPSAFAGGRRMPKAAGGLSDSSLSFSNPQGISHWAAKAAHWSLRNQVKNKVSFPSHEHFLSQWMCILSRPITWEPLEALSKVLLQFHDALATLSQSGVLPGATIFTQADVSAETATREKKRQRITQRKHQLALEAKQMTSKFQDEGWTIALSDGLAKQHPKVG